MVSEPVSLHTYCSDKIVYDNFKDFFVDFYSGAIFFSSVIVSKLS